MDFIVFQCCLKRKHPMSNVVNCGIESRCNYPVAKFRFFTKIAIGFFIMLSMFEVTAIPHYNEI